MATITEKQLMNGNCVYRVRFRYKGIREFSVNFDSWDYACDWVEKNEGDFLMNPDSYFEWKQQNCHEMRRQKLDVKDHVVLTRKRRLI